MSKTLQIKNPKFSTKRFCYSIHIYRRDGTSMYRRRGRFEGEERGGGLDEDNEGWAQKKDETGTDMRTEMRGE